jgi:hypothetical protein
MYKRVTKSRTLPTHTHTHTHTNIHIHKIAHAHRYFEGTWQTLQPQPASATPLARSEHSACTLFAQAMVIHGGWDYTSPGGEAQGDLVGGAANVTGDVILFADTYLFNAEDLSVRMLTVDMKLVFLC